MKKDRRLPSRTPSTLDSILSVFDSTVDEIRGLGLPKLGPDFATLNPVELHDALVSHRASAKYEIPNASSAQLRRETSIQDVISADEEGWSSFDYRRLPHHHRAHFLNARNWLAALFKKFRCSYTARFPSGEGLESQYGDVDLVTKLSGDSQWVCSPDLVDYSVKILLNNRALLVVLKNRYKKLHGDGGRLALDRLRRAYIKATPGGGVAGLRYQMVRFMFRACTKLERVARVTTVPKNNSKDRVISCEAMWTMICQLSFAQDLRNCLTSIGIDLDSLANLHRALIRTGKATIDMRRASDRNFMCVLRELWPPKMSAYLDIIRSGVFVRESKGEVDYHPLRMFAPMGCGCTFEVMTITLLAYTRVLDKGSSVFGDDIIIEQRHASSLIEFLQSVGWLINNEKSFVDGPFRESCGAFADLRTQKLLLSYDFVRPTQLSECYTLAHKVLHLSYALSRDSAVRKILMRCYAELHVYFPRDALRVIDACSLRPSAGLSQVCFFTFERFILESGVRRSTEASRCLATQWQRSVHISMSRHDIAVTRKPVQAADAVHYLAFLRRGRSYAVPTGRVKVVMIPCDRETGTAINSVVLASVL